METVGRADGARRPDLGRIRMERVPEGRAALVVGHPGHELRVHGWLELTAPLTFVLTDGSGRTGQSRLASTTTVLEAAGARRGSIYGRVTDREIYAAILDHDFVFFTDLAEELAEALAQARIDYVAGDAIESYNPSHDVCRMVIDAAIEIACRTRSRCMASYDFLLVGHPGGCPEELRDRAAWLTLDDASLERKIESARRYPELAAEVDAALNREGGMEPFRTECLRPVSPSADGAGDATETPYYERYGEKQVAAGHYERVIRYREHILPLAAALRGRAESRT